MNSARVVCFGEALWDVSPTGRTPGGAPLNVAMRLAERGIDVALVSRVGSDELGRELVAHMRSCGLSTRNVQIDTRRETGRVNVDKSDQQNVRYEILAPAAWDFIEADAFLTESGAQTDVLVFGSLAARSEGSRRSLLQLLERARLRVFDVNLRPPFDSRDTIMNLLERSDWIKLNEIELDTIARWFGMSGSRESVLEALCKQCRIDTACVTLGSEGAIMYRSDELSRHPGFSVPVVDTIGCGDAFLAAWLAQLLSGAVSSRALRFACAAGAIVATGDGASVPVAANAIDDLIGPDQGLID